MAENPFKPIHPGMEMNVGEGAGGQKNVDTHMLTGLSAGAISDQRSYDITMMIHTQAENWPEKLGEDIRQYFWDEWGKQNPNIPIARSLTDLMATMCLMELLRAGQRWTQEYRAETCECPKTTWHVKYNRFYCDMLQRLEVAHQAGLEQAKDVRG